MDEPCRLQPTNSFLKELTRNVFSPLLIFKKIKDIDLILNHFRLAYSNWLDDHHFALSTNCTRRASVFVMEFDVGVINNMDLLKHEYYEIWTEKGDLWLINSWKKNWFYKIIRNEFCVLGIFYLNNVCLMKTESILSKFILWHFENFLFSHLMCDLLTWSFPKTGKYWKKFGCS